MQNQEPTSFYWHDYETFGLKWPECRPAQFAGIRTGIDLGGEGSADVWYCRPSMDLLPSVDACLVTGITPATAMEKGVPEADFAALIHRAMNEPGTVSIGYNSIGFDDEVTRLLFWRNFLDVYGRENTGNECARWDLYPLVLAVWALRPDGISWPVITEGDRKGKISFRLEKLSEANCLLEGRAHDAANDVRSTIALARLIKARQPRLWNWAFRNRTRSRVRTALSSGRICVWIDSYAGQERGYIRCVLPVTQTSSNRSETVVWDCREDPSVLVGMPPEEIARLVFSREEDLGKDERKPALCSLKINRAPFVCPDIRILDGEVCRRFSISLEEVGKNARRLLEILGDIRGPVLTAWDTRFPGRLDGGGGPARDPDVALYDGFTPDSDRSMMARLRQAGGSASIFEAVREGRVHFADSRLQALLPRMLARSWPELLNDGERAEWLAWCRTTLGGRLQDCLDSIDSAYDRCEQAIAAGEISSAEYEERQRVLADLYQWAEDAGRLVSGS